MLYHFPIPYPDETLYSIYARYHQSVGNLSPKQTTEELYGKRTIRSVSDLPSNLELLAKRLNNKYVTSDYLIDHHTFFPYYGAFFMKHQYGKVRVLMKTENGERIHTTAGISASNVKPKLYFMHCSKCFHEDLKTYGESYWHRSHQLPGLVMCHKHETPLLETSVPVKADNQHEYILAIEENVLENSHELKVNEEIKEQHIRFSKLSYDLLSTQYRQKESNSLQKLYKVKLKENGLAANSGNVRRKELYRSFLSTLNNEFLATVQSNVEFKEADWLTMIFQHHRKSFHPVRHLLIMMYFGGKIDGYFENRKEYYPFGEGQWVCLNPVCKDYRKRSIKDLKITRCYDTKKPVGTFICDCGFVYSRRGPDKCQEDRYKVGRIKKFGHVWEDKLRECINNNMSLTRIAKEMKCDPITVKRQAVLLEISFSWSGENLNEAKVNNRFIKRNGVQSSDTALKQRQEEWIELQQNNPGLSKTELRQLNPEVYALLYRRDREWLNEHSPNGRKKVVVNSRVNWNDRDKEVLQMVSKVVKDWDKNMDRLTRITVGSIGKKIGLLSLLQKKGDKLPLTMKYLKSVIEDVEAFQLRRVKWIVEQMKYNDEEIMEWIVFKRAGLRPEVSNKVKRLVTVLSSEN